jgi:DNA-binding response OmpR family regulator
MVIDDSKLIRLTVRKFLQEQVAVVVELDQVELLLQEPWRARDVDLLILDINLSGIDGISAMQKMQRIDSLRKLPVMILTAASDRQTVCKALACGAVEFMTKPLIRDELIRRVENVIGPLDDGVADRIQNEISRAKRGNTALAVIKITMESSTHSQVLRETQLQLQTTLRSIDTVLVSRERAIIVILPITGQEGGLVVSNTITEVIASRKDITIDCSLSQATYPDDGKTADELLNALKEREVANDFLLEQSAVRV